jgi:hypothetical protein
MSSPNLRGSASSSDPNIAGSSSRNTLPNEEFATLLDSGYMKVKLDPAQPNLADYPEYFQDYSSTYTYQDLDFIADDPFDFYETQNPDQIQPFLDMPLQTFENDYLPIPKGEQEELDPLFTNGYIDPPIAFEEAPALSNIPTTTTSKGANPNKGVESQLGSTTNGADPIEGIELRLDSPRGIGSNSLLNSKNGPTYPSDPPKPTKREKGKLEEIPRRTQANPRTKGRNKRHENILKFDATELYEPLPEIPGSWSTPNSEFQYNKFGELNTRLRLTQEQMLDFLYLHPLHSLDGDYDPRNSALTLWIQSVPADSNRRYPSLGSDKCRFASCLAKHNTIHKGFFRVAIDEHSRSSIKVDPFHCAGFVHLYCLEKFLNFPSLCKKLNIRPDNRLLIEPRNKMALTRDYNELYGIAENFIKNSEDQTTWDYTKTLSYELTMKYIELEPDSRSRKRKKTGGNHLNSHLGDLEVFVEGERKKYADRKRRRGNPGEENSDKENNAEDRKRRREDLDEEDSLDNQSNEDNKDYNPRPCKRERL